MANKFLLATLGEARPILIAGATASGKSALALDIATQLGGVIVNADALQVYRGWRILTARPSARDERRAPHALYGHVANHKSYSVGDWLRDISPILFGDKRPIIVGGTGLYLRALTEGLADIPPIPTAIRTQSSELLSQGSLKPMLDALDAETRAQIDVQNPMRVARAWEVLQATGQSIRSWQVRTPPPLLPLETCHALHLTSPVDWLNYRLKRRFDMMIAEGALDEARRNLKFWDSKWQSSKAIGAPELIAHLRGHFSLDEAKTRAVTASSQFAKRQRTWFRKRMIAWQTLAAEQL
ncbi:tRNA (adenosine(37)-N6)-dimethylallyltransferase MiaA [Planktomarina sp.]|uniref:tRNA (adenosine(37)-N6)-dimethylallyltransferase MiaA n=1 Tax=Planktomarina sp. TaxID=2024851 RepID=UPI0028907F69|nr:tRNA (adenosine(37)-N6)-dimethylallyltransferase MiaA [Planktomarina sp.]